MRAIKRERYAVKELKQLKSVLENAENKDVDMSDICRILPEGTLSKSQTSESNKDKSGESLQSGAMEVDGVSRYHKTKLTNEHGNYPIWMNQRAVKKHKARLSKLGRLQKKRGKKNKK